MEVKIENDIIKEINYGDKKRPILCALTEKSVTDVMIMLNIVIKFEKKSSILNNLYSILKEYCNKKENINIYLNKLL